VATIAGKTGMNGIISHFDKSRVKISIRVLNAAAIGFSLFGGFLAGMNLDLTNHTLFTSLHDQRIRFESIQWIKNAPAVRISLLGESPQESTVQVPAPDLMKITRSPARFAAEKDGVVRPSFNLRRLKRVIESIETHERDDFTDFQIAANLHRGAFKTLEERRTESKEEWVWGNDLSVQVPVPRPKAHSDWTKVSASSEKEPESKIEPKTESRVEQITLASSLSEQEKSDLTGLLLQEQLKYGVGNSAPTPPAPSNTRPLILAQNQGRADRVQKAFSENTSFKTAAASSDPGPCGLGIQHVFSFPVNDSSSGPESLTCPEKLTWISKSWTQEGWIRVEGPRHTPTITRQPAPNNAETLLFDEQQLGAIFVKTGTRITKGMGNVIGLLPAGYKVEFTGRSEETVYFESNGKQFFAILNVEPGAGVLELVSEKSQDLNTTIFVPVLDDTITFLALSEPEIRDIPVRVSKNGTSNDPEVVGLTVGLSTQSSIQAITKSDGTAMLSNVHMIKGYPGHVDIGSRQGQEPGYLYRYELGNPDSNGVYHLNQVAEKSLDRWLGQVKQGLSDQGALVVGAYHRSRIDGFRDEYRVETKPLTAKFGLEPLTYTLLWNGEISLEEPLEGDLPRFMSVQVSEGLSQVALKGPKGEMIRSDLIPVSPRVIHVLSP
jgi:hypothetical protein